jgi:hypothetical protein
MKKIGFILVLTHLFVFGTTIKAQELEEGYLGLPGDNLNLYAVMELFQESQTLEGFERSINDSYTKVNNLDLNGDNLVDYLTVTDHVDGIFHTIVIQDALGPNDIQDVAVFTVQKLSDGSVQIQLIGDETLYGKNYIIEPNYNNDGVSPNNSYMEQRDNVTVVLTTPHEVSYWPVIRFIYNPEYVVWRSLWYWGNYPNYWHNWNPFSWHYYYGYHSNMYPEYYSHYRHWDSPRYSHFNTSYYHGFRSYSPQVNNRIREGRYRSTYSHPEMRHDGEAYYSRTHSDRSRPTSPGSFHNSPNHEFGNNRTNEHRVENPGSFNHTPPSSHGNSGNRITPGNNPGNHSLSHPSPANPGSFNHTPPSSHGNSGNRITPGNNPGNHGLSHPSPANPGSFNHTTPSSHGNNGNRITPGNSPGNHGLSHPSPANPGSFNHTPTSSHGNNGNRITPGNNPDNHGPSHPSPANPGSFNHTPPSSHGNNGNRITPVNNPVNHGSSHPSPANPGSFNHTPPPSSGNNGNRITPGSNPVNHGSSHPKPENSGSFHGGSSSPQKNHNENLNSMKKPSGNMNQVHNQAPPAKRDSPGNRHDKGGR